MDLDQQCYKDRSETVEDAEIARLRQRWTSPSRFPSDLDRVRYTTPILGRNKNREQEMTAGRTIWEERE
ncbi:hypothetical protein N7495_000560 [Penicillium taxi]|uniref:uncharacterized protein n=1 Tax=Penicillium taxi TaxID=168475 RepID=UPI0025455086|nr:uncharacterized protein N7495_000560 [Penicillium taxi]KAJ5907878.1 hypothetical protein N7495_000560 [Penicillium taxi]